MESSLLKIRRWKQCDADDLYEYAKDPEIGPPAGWPPHMDKAESAQVIRTVFSGPEDYAICLRPEDRPVGAISLKMEGESELASGDDECELGYWLGRPYWGRGIMTEAGMMMLDHAFEDIGMERVWCAYYEGNDRSAAVQRRLGFRHQRTEPEWDVPLMGEKRICHINILTREEWLRDRNSKQDKSEEKYK